jgi:hypothetical protein
MNGSDTMIDLVELTKKAFQRYAPRVIGVAEIRCNINGKEDNPFEQNLPPDAEIIAAVNELVASGFAVRKQNGWQIKLPDHDLKVLRDLLCAKQIQSVTDLPEAIIKFSGKVADVDEEWQMGDIVQYSRLTGHRLPMKHLIWAHTDGEYYVVHYEIGGFIHFAGILFAKLEGGERRKIFWWRTKSFEDLKAFLDFIVSK